jgi:hypothetical protein
LKKITSIQKDFFGNQTLGNYSPTNTRTALIQQHLYHPKSLGEFSVTTQLSVADKNLTHHTTYVKFFGIATFSSKIISAEWNQKTN